MAVNSYGGNGKIDTPPTSADANMRKAHTQDSVEYNLSHFEDHGNAIFGSLDKLKTVDPAKAKKMAQIVQECLDKLENKLSSYGAVDAHDKGDTMADKTPIKKTGSTGGEPNRLGGGGRFKQMTNKGMSPALAAYIGRKKYGAKMMANMAAKGKKQG